MPRIAENRRQTVGFVDDRIDDLLKWFYDHGVIEAEPYYKGMVFPAPSYEELPGPYRISPSGFTAEPGDSYRLFINSKERHHIEFDFLKGFLAFFTGSLQLVITQETPHYILRWGFSSKVILEHLGQEYYSSWSLGSGLFAFRQEMEINPYEMRWKIDQLDNVILINEEEYVHPMRVWSRLLTIFYDRFSGRSRIDRICFISSWGLQAVWEIDEDNQVFIKEFLEPFPDGKIGHIGCHVFPSVDLRTLVDVIESKRRRFDHRNHKYFHELASEQLMEEQVVPYLSSESEKEIPQEDYLNYLK